MEYPSIHVLMTGAGAPGAPGIIQCLLRDPAIRLTVADADPEAVGRYLAPQFTQLPPGDSPEFAQRLLAYCMQHEVRVVLPLVTRELLPLARNRDLFEQKGIRLLLSSEEALCLANHKFYCYERLQQSGLPVPRFALARTEETFREAVARLGYPGRDVCFKPTVSNGSRGFRVLSARVNEYDLLLHQKPYQTHIGFEEACRILSSGPFPELLVSEYLPGEEYSVDCLAKQGRASLVIPRLRSRTVNGISTKGAFIKDEAIIAYCREIIRVLDLHGNIGIQLKRSNGGAALLLEINPRVQGTIVSALGAGVNLPLLAVKQELELPVDPRELELDWSTRFSRYWTEVYYK